MTTDERLELHRWQACVHEAAHAVVAWEHGILFHHVSVEHSPGESFPFTGKTLPITQKPAPEKAEVYLSALAAGCLAESQERSTGGYLDRWLGKFHDDLLHGLLVSMQKRGEDGALFLKLAVKVASESGAPTVDRLLWERAVEAATVLHRRWEDVQATANALASEPWMESGWKVTRLPQELPLAAGVTLR